MPDMKLTEQVKNEYQRLFSTITIDPNKKEVVKKIVDKILNNQPTYETIGAEYKISWYVVGIIHYKNKEVENSPENTNLTWNEGQDKGKLLNKLPKLSDTSVPAILYQLEESDMAWAYQNMQPAVRSPYLWGASTHYNTGYFKIKNGQQKEWREEKSSQIGTAVLLREMRRIEGEKMSEDMSQPISKEYADEHGVYKKKDHKNGVYRIFKVKDTKHQFNDRNGKELCKVNGDGRELCTPNTGLLCFGNYARNLPMIPLQAVFGLRFDTGYEKDSNVSRESIDNTHVVALDVYDWYSGEILSQRRLTRSDFLPVLDPDLDHVRLFRLDFTPPSPYAILEFRIYYNGSNSTLIADKIVVIDPAKVQLVLPELRPSEVIKEFDVSENLLLAPTSTAGCLCCTPEAEISPIQGKSLKAIFRIFKSKYLNESFPILDVKVFVASSQYPVYFESISHDKFLFKDGGYINFELDFNISKKTPLRFQIDYRKANNPSNLKEYYIRADKIWVVRVNSAAEKALYFLKEYQVRSEGDQIPVYWPWP